MPPNPGDLTVLSQASPRASGDAPNPCAEIVSLRDFARLNATEIAGALVISRTVARDRADARFGLLPRLRPE